MFTKKKNTCMNDGFCPINNGSDRSQKIKYYQSRNLSTENILKWKKNKDNKSELTDSRLC